MADNANHFLMKSHFNKRFFSGMREDKIWSKNREKKTMMEDEEEGTDGHRDKRERRVRWIETGRWKEKKRFQRSRGERARIQRKHE